ncbi:hypothetical protein BG418_15450 [Streptomyces sp. CBMA152]|nr:hypothetical protein [Streptomyces sp. CBMA152]
MSTDELAFSVRTRTVGGTLIIELRGELDILAYHECAASLRELTPRDALDVVLDLRPVTFLDASGIRLLLTVRDEVARHGGRLRLVRAVPRVWQVLRIVRLDSVFTAIDDLPPSLTETAAA